MQQSLVHPEGKLCGWCHDEQATTEIYATPTGMACAATDRKGRVQRWLNGVARRIKGK